jgi:hypothetical protein
VLQGIWTVAAAAVVLGAAGPLWAGDATHPCAAVKNPEARLACFDAAFAAPREHQGRDEPAAVTAAPQTAAEGIEEFGLSAAQLQARNPERGSEPRLERIEAKVAEIQRRSSTGERIIRLDNGQVWLQTEVTVRGPLSTGDEVVIRRAALNSFQIVTPGGVALRVRRIQ